MYDLKTTSGLKNEAKLVKDIISFTNTIRTESSYIVIGVAENDDGTKDLIGTDEFVDDSNLQEKVKDKVYPRAVFSYYQFEYESKIFGIFEFPVSKYPIPVSASVKMKGLEVGRVFYRRGTSNSEAIGIETIKINDWLKSLPETPIKSTSNKNISGFLNRLTDNTERLSTIIADLFAKTNELGSQKLTLFCQFELKGFNQDFSEGGYDYRIQQVLISRTEFELNPNSFVQVTSTSVYNELIKNENFSNVQIRLTQPTLEIERQVEASRNNPNAICTTHTTTNHTLYGKAKDNDFTVYIYTFTDNYQIVYRNIRQKAIDLLMEMTT